MPGCCRLSHVRKQAPLGSRASRVLIFQEKSKTSQNTLHSLILATFFFIFLFLEHEFFWGTESCMAPICLQVTCSVPCSLDPLWGALVFRLDQGRSRGACLAWAMCLPSPEGSPACPALPCPHCAARQQGSRAGVPELGVFGEWQGPVALQTLESAQESEPAWRPEAHMAGAAVRWGINLPVV